MKTIVDRSGEKIELAKEFGMNGYVKNRLSEIEKKEAIKELTGMKFRPITEDEIVKKIANKRYFDMDVFMDMKDFHSAHFAGAVLILSGSFVGFLQNEAFKFFIASLILTLPMLAICYGVRFYMYWQKPRVKSIPLSLWEDEIPYGALLALKEAKEFGVNHQWIWNIYEHKNDYKIYYPAVGSKRIQADPVITGLYKGVEVEIFSWDDGKVYE